MRVALKLLVARMSAPAATKRARDPGDHVGPGQVEQVVIAALVVVERKLAAIVGLLQPLGLDLGSVGAVLDEDALSPRRREYRCGDGHARTPSR